ncbi:hypothetical protein RFF73_10690 [Streptococcus ruminantium]|nr:NAD(P)H-hydrate dehydratase [Streptococcus ruminantium]MDQ8766030.1 hypothetical protein [Streptococcus ruminantium]MDQ8781217.1 hypothetical protein [Streptococcus ruminantium]MDQ8821430.1 hypothetical protein [Streptococcus ruminantium]
MTLIARKHRKDFPCKQVILTPHQKEWERLSTIPVTEQNSEKKLAGSKNFPRLYNLGF